MARGVPSTCKGDTAQLSGVIDDNDRTPGKYTVCTPLHVRLTSRDKGLAMDNEQRLGYGDAEADAASSDRRHY